MARPANYLLKDGTRVPGVTTVGSLIKESGGLVHWAWELGKAGQDYRTVRDEAATAGHMAHAAVEAWIRKIPYVWTGDPLIVQRAQKAFGAFEDWAKQSRLEVTQPEVSIISETYRVGGTLDAIFLSGKRAIGDWKTADGVYAENLLQLAAYGRLWGEANPTEPITGGYHLVRFSKSHGDFVHHWWPEFEDAWDAWLHCRQLYDLRAALKSRCR